MTLSHWFQRLITLQTAAQHQTPMNLLPECLTVRQLEERRVLSASAILVGTEVTFTGDSGGASTDSLVFSIDGAGFLQHNQAGQNGFETSLDLDSTVAGEQKLEVDQITELNVMLGSGNDSVAFAGEFHFSAGSLSVEAESITTPGGSLAVQGLTSLNAGAANDIVLAGANQFHTIEIVAAHHVTLHDVDDLDWTGNSQISGNLNLTVGGALSNLAASQISVGGLADLEASSIQLGSAAGDLIEWGTLSFHSTGHVQIEEDNSTGLVGDSSADSLQLHSAGGITDSTDSLQVTGLADLSGSSIHIGGATTTTHLGVLSFDSTGAVEIAEDDNMHLTGENAAVSLDLDSTGDLTDSSDSLVVTGMAQFHAANISLGGPASNTHFGTLAFDSTGNVTIQEDSSTVVSASSVAHSLQLASSDSIAVNALLHATDAVTLQSGSDVVINSALTSGGTVIVNANGDVLALAAISGSTIELHSEQKIDGQGPLTAGTIDLAARTGIGMTGPLQLTGSQVSAVTTSGAVTLDNTASAHYSLLHSGSGPITVVSEQTVTLGAISTVDQSIRVKADQGDLTLLQAIDAGTGSVTLDALNGNLVDGNDGATLISAGDLSLLAHGNIGDITDFATASGNAIDVQLTGQLQQATVSNSGGEIFINSPGDLSVAAGAVNVGGVAVASAILRATGGDLHVGGAASGLHLSDGDQVALQAIKQGGQGGVLVLPDSGLNVGVGNLSLRGDEDVFDSAGRDLGPLVASHLQLFSGSTGGNTTLETDVSSISAQLTSAGAALMINEADGIDLTSLETNGGHIAVQASQSAPGDIRVFMVNATNARVTLDNSSIPGGTILDGDPIDDPTSADIIAQEIDLRSDQGIANDQKLEIVTDRLAAITRQGQVNVRDVSGNLSIAALDQGTSGVSITSGRAGDNISVSTTGLLSVDADVTNSGDGQRQTLLASDGSTLTNDLVVNARIRGIGGDASTTLLAGDSIQLENDSVTAASGTGNVHMRAGRSFQNGGVETAGTAVADLIMSGTAVIQTDGGNVSMSAPDNIDVTSVQAITGRISLLADADHSGAGTIADSSLGETTNLSSGSASLSAATGIGAPGGDSDLDIAVSTLEVVNTTGGSVQISEADAVTVTRLSQSGSGDSVVRSSNGSITVDNSGLPPGSIEMLGGGALTLQADGANSDIIVHDSITSNNGDLTLIAGRDVLTTSAPIFIAGDSGDISIAAGRDIRITDPTNSVADDLRVSGSGNITLLAANQLVLGSLSPTLPDSLQHTQLNDVVLRTGTGSVTNTLPVLFDLQAPQVTAGGEAVMTVTVGRPGESNLAVRLFWGDGTVDTITGLAAGTYSFHHFYTANPDPVNPAAPILVNVQVAHDPHVFLAAPPLNTPVGSVINGGVSVPPPVPAQNINADLAAAIYDTSSPHHLAIQRLIVTSPGSESSPGMVIFQDTVIRATTIPVPGEGLATFVFDTTPPVSHLTLPEVVKIIDTRPASQVQLSEGGIAGLVAASVDEVTIAERHVILEIVTSTGEVTQQTILPESTLDSLQDVISRLPDGHYRFQLKEAGDERLRLLLEFEVRQGKIADQTDDSDRPPSAKPPKNQASPPVDETSRIEPMDDGQLDRHSTISTIPIINRATHDSNLKNPPTIQQSAQATWQAATWVKTTSEHEHDWRVTAPNNGEETEQNTSEPVPPPSPPSPAQSLDAVGLGSVVAMLGAGILIEHWTTPKSGQPARFGRLSRFLRHHQELLKQDPPVDPNQANNRQVSQPSTSPWGELPC